MSKATILVLVVCLSVASAIVPMSLHKRVEQWESVKDWERPSMPKEMLKPRVHTPATVEVTHGPAHQEVPAFKINRFESLSTSTSNACAGYPVGFPFCPPHAGGCPAFGTRSWNDIAGYLLIGSLFGVPPATAPQQIYSTWPQPFLGCLQAYCNLGNPDPVCHYITAARGARSQIQIGVVHQLYQNVVCHSATDCTPWNILTSNLTIPGNVLSQNVQMRINPLGYFPVFPVVAGYFYALGQPPPNTNVTGQSRISQVFFTSPDRAYGNVVCGHVDLESSEFVTNANPSNFTHYYCYAFDENNQITSGEVNFRHLGTLSDLPDCIPGLNVEVAESICPEIQYNCVGANQQYASVADCVAYVGSLPTATWDKANQANLPCVELHTLLTVEFPSIHCPHVGPTGGGFCTNAHTYDWDYTAVPSDLLIYADPSY